MSEEKKKKKKTPITEIKLRSYPKIIFFYPLLFTSLILSILSPFASPEAASWLAVFWLIVLCCNLFVIAFDFGSSKFFILIMAIVIIILLCIFWIFPTWGLPTFENIKDFPGMAWEFYLAITIILSVILLLVIFDAFFDYWKVERNEIYHKSGIFSSAERFPVKSLRWKKEIPDVFEFFVLRAGTLTLMPGRVEETITLHTVLNVNKKAEQLDYLLSHVKVEIDQLDG